MYIYNCIKIYVYVCIHVCLYICVCVMYICLFIYVTKMKFLAKYPKTGDRVSP